MLVDAIRAEGFRLSKSRTTWFWSVFFVPIMFVIGGAIFQVINKVKGDEAAAAAGIPEMPVSPLNLAESLMFGAQWSANGIILVCMLIAAATVYAGDYRWETWRLISARNSRTSLILGKMAVVKIVAMAATLAFLVAAVIYYLTQAIVFQRPLTFSIGGAELGQAALIWLLCCVRIVQFTIMAMLVAVVTRSLLAALFVTWGLGFVQSLVGIPPIAALLGWQPTDWTPQLLMPGLAFDTLKSAIAPSIQIVPDAGSALAPAIVSLALWTLLPLAGALLWFNRQDLSKE
ncbi:hypothetical protein [Brevundimonas sp.]